MKKRNKRKLLRIIAVVLTISMLVTAMPPITSSAKEIVAAKEAAHESWSPEEIQLPNTEGDLTLEQLKTAKLAAEDTPEIGQDRGRFYVLINMCIGDKRTVPLSLTWEKKHYFIR